MIHESWFLTQSVLWKSILISYHDLMSISVWKCWLTFSILGQSCEPRSPPEKSVLRVRDGTTCFIFDFQNWLHFVDNFLLFYLISFSQNNHLQLWPPKLFASYVKLFFGFLSTKQWTEKKSERPVDALAVKFRKH